jgi:uncharacterized membrane protein
MREKTSIWKWIMTISFISILSLCVGGLISGYWISDMDKILVILFLIFAFSILGDLK